MSESSNKLIRFWQELKRRKVFGVVTTYAAAAYIIIEVTNNLAIPLHLPDWFASLEFIILLIGLPVAVTLSWIFDFTPKGIKKTESVEESEIKEVAGKTAKRRLRPSYVLNAVLIIAVIVLAYPKIFKQDRFERLRSSGERISIAVMPFQNLTNDTIWNIWQDGIQDILINNLTNSEELVVRQIESISDLIQSKGLNNYASITPTIASDISQKLKTNIFIYGSIKQVGTTIRLNAQLIDNKSGETYKSFQIDGTADNILQITDSLSIMVKNFLIISELREQATPGFQNPLSTNSPDAYRFYLMGNNAFGKKDFPEAIKLFLQAKEIDSNYIDAQIKIPDAFGNQGLYKQAKEWCLKLYAKRDKMTLKQKLKLNYIYANCFETPYESIKYLSQLKEIDDQNPNVYYSIGVENASVNQFDKAIPEFEKALEIYKKWGVKPAWIYNYTNLGFVYHETGQYREEKKLYKQAEQDFPDDFDLIYQQAVLSLAEGDTISANRYTEKLKTIFKGNYSTDEAAISWILAKVYSDADIIDQAEIFFRETLALEPEVPDIMNFLAYFLIDKDRNINEGLELTEKALELNPENYDCLHTKGWGLYKQGRYQEALETLQKSWDIRREQAIYDHEAYLHLEAAKKAVAGQKNN
jgi:tetratricopeptide (TPR) repeat protein